MNLVNLFQKAGKCAVGKIASINWFDGVKSWQIYHQVMEIIQTVEQLWRNGQLNTDNGKKALAMKVIGELFESLGIIVTQESISGFIDVVVAILNKVGILNHG